MSELNFDLVLDTAGDGEGRRRFTWRWHDSTPMSWWITYLKIYRGLRIRVPYAAPGSPDLDGARNSGMFYGMTRQEARDRLTEFVADVDFYMYLGGK